MRNLILLLSLLCGCLIAALTINLARAQDNDSDRNTWSAGVELDGLTNCDDAAINSAVTCGGTRGVRSAGYNVLTLEINYARSAGTGYEFYLEGCSEGHATTDCTTDADWGVIAGQEYSAGTLTLRPAKVLRVISANDVLTWTVGMNYQRFRLKDFVATGTPDANDKITVLARLSTANAF